MAKYFFNFENSEAFDDVEGTEFTDVPAVQEAAASLGGEMLRDNPNGIWTDGRWLIEVADEWGVPVVRLCLTAEILSRAALAR